MKTILITGCSSGIGLHCATQLKHQGYRVFATARKPEDVRKLKSQGFESHQLDLDDSDSIQKAVAWVFELTGGQLDALFNNGAYGQPGAVEDLTRDVLRQQLETNLLGWLELTNLVIPAMRQHNSGRLIMNSSVLGLISMKYRGAYNCSKYALEGLTDTLRQELKGSGIHVSLIEPGPIESDFRKNAYAAFLRNINTDVSAHKSVYLAVKQRLSNQNAGEEPPLFTLSADAVFKKLKQALESPRPKARYYVTVPTYLFGILKRVLSTRWLDYLLVKVAEGENKQ
ncbi:SDR family NAD(P)-dependent oxidoreductase [Motiliproteus sp. MSK22-1]|uniref:SDR family NAD(P)-dependent oxidoreductase n=1 Tax=Motiliproteus sp. MSK22-1 TaxID=1897630 RepID=UPI00097853DC|nr:SDR family NAD(P)-dependent oxidoreductase [Motiliproteus sp. MSK22-1]OMH32772.1 short-chain dehydrogenase [Motiliproteus sp. MSK22-1]